MNYVKHMIKKKINVVVVTKDIISEDDLYKLKCKKCSDIVKNCNKCHGEIYSVTCDDFNRNDQ